MDETLIGSTHFSFSTITSTNRFAQLLLSKTRPRAGTVISTAYQSAGEGQFGRSWFGSKGTNLCLSVILYPQILATAQFTLSAFVAMALRDTVAHLIDQKVSIKWPNDIYAGDRKIAGILIQNSIAGRSIQHSVIGIGLNVNERAFPEAIPNATSLSIEAGGNFTTGFVMQILLQYLNDWLRRAENLPLDMLKKQYTNHLYRLGKTSTFHDVENDKELSANITGVDKMGRLLLQFSDKGPIKKYTLNQIRHRIP